MLFNFTFEGNLGDEPELRFTPTGKAVCKLRVGHNTRRRNSAGEWVNGATMWVTVTVWEALAEHVAASLHKGDTVIVEARDDLNVWAYLSQSTDKPAGQLQVSAANIARSLRFGTDKPAPKAAGDVDDSWAADADRELEPAF